MSIKSNLSKMSDKSLFATAMRYDVNPSDYSFNREAIIEDVLKVILSNSQRKIGFANLNQSVNSHTFDFFKIDSIKNMKSEGNSIFSFNDRYGKTRTFKFATEGLHYFAFNMRDTYTYADVSERIATSDYEWFSHVVNSNTHLFDRSFVFCMMDEKVVGFPKHYNPMQHSNIIELIESENLESAVISSVLSTDGLVVDLSLTSLVSDFHKAGVRIINGHSGLKAFSYRYYVTFGNVDYEFQGIDGNYSRNRHLSWIGDTNRSLKAALEEMSGFSISDKLKSISFNTVKSMLNLAIPEMNNREEKLMQMVSENFNGDDAYSFCEFLAHASEKTGYFKPANKMITIILNTVI